MPQTSTNNNVQKIIENPTIEQEPFKCQDCGHPFEHFVVEKIGDLAQLRVGNVIMGRAEMICLACGRISYWNLKTSDIKKMAVRYGQILGISSYNPE
jgi:hypothetical protein